jgi:DNA (cytosine-5)-methyltransferase 1
MRFLSVCSGIEAASVAWNPLGWEAVAFSEIEPFPCALLKHHYPRVPNLGDMTKFAEWPDLAIDLLCGGTPCQSFSIAGLRKGLADPRGNLMLTFGAIAARHRPRWLVWENVPGVLSSNGGRDFGSFLGMLGQLGYGFAYRVLDAQYFGVAQRRRRVFVVGCLGDWRSAAAVLFERHSLQGHPAPSRETGEKVAGTLERSAGDWSRDEPGASVVTHALTGEGFDASEDGTGRGTPLVPVAFAASDYQSGTFDQVQQAAPLTTSADRTRAAPILAFSAKDHGADAQEDIAPTLRAGGHANSHANAGVMPAIAFQSSQSGVREVEAHATLDANNGSRRHNGVVQAMQVRRLTPRECERLQGFPDDYTLIPLPMTARKQRKGEPDTAYADYLARREMRHAADGPRYKALGNSWAVPNVRWIGRRINNVQALIDQREEIAA